MQQQAPCDHSFLCELYDERCCGFHTRPFACFVRLALENGDQNEMLCCCCVGVGINVRNYNYPEPPILDK